jgi:hypothetical protein
MKIAMRVFVLTLVLGVSSVGFASAHSFSGPGPVPGPNGFPPVQVAR